MESLAVLEKVISMAHLTNFYDDSKRQSRGWLFTLLFPRKTIICHHAFLNSHSDDCQGWLAGCLWRNPRKVPHRHRTIPINHSMDKVFSSRFLLLLLAEISFRVNHVPVIYKPCTVDTSRHGHSIS